MNRATQIVYRWRGRLVDEMLRLRHPLPDQLERFNSVYGAASAARLAGDREGAALYYAELLGMAAPDSPRPEMSEARKFIEAPL